MKHAQTADDAFVSDLERQLASKLRRQQRFNGFAPSNGRNKTAKILLLIVLCTATGVAGAKALERLESIRQAKILIARAQTAITVLEAHHNMAEEMATEIRHDVEAGLIHARELIDAEHQVEILGHELEKARLDLEEVYVSRRSPSDEIFAPKPGGRDFVSARLLVDRDIIAAQKGRLGAELTEIERLVEQGLVHESETRHLSISLGMFDEHLDVNQGRLDLRRSFLAGEITAAEASRNEMLTRARADLASAERANATATAQFESLEAARANGLVEAMDVKQAEVHLRATRAELQLARMEVEVLEDAAAE